MTDLKPEDIKEIESSHTNALNVLPGDYMVVNKDCVITTILGSCVAACIRDPVARVGGLNHFLLPEKPDSIISQATRYGSHAMETLINEIIKKGGHRERLEVKVFGGANIFNHMHPVGTNNVEFVLNYLKKENFKIVSSDLGGSKARRIFYFPFSGKVDRLFLTSNKDVITTETQYEKNLSKNLEKDSKAKSDDIELW